MYRIIAIVLGEDGWDEQPSRSNKLRNTKGRVSRADRQTIPTTARPGQRGKDTALPDTRDFDAAESLETNRLESRPGRGNVVESSRLSLMERIQTADAGKNPTTTVALSESAILASGGI